MLHFHSENLKKENNHCDDNYTDFVFMLKGYIYLLVNAFLL